MAKKTTDHIQMLCEIGELNNLFTKSFSIESFLEKIVVMMRAHMHADVCSIYLYDEKNKMLTLSATKGLKSSALKVVKLKLGEGLVGLALKELRPIVEKIASKNPNFRFFPGIEEEKYEAFLAVPILQGKSRIGVLTVQRRAKHDFSEKDVMALKATSNQLASMIENARILMTHTEKAISKPDFELIRNLKMVKGKSGSQGLAYAPIAIFSQETSSAFFNQSKFQKKYTLAEFKKAVKKTERQLEQLQERVEETLSDVASLIFTAHLLMLKDEALMGPIVELIEAGENPPVAALKVGRKFRDIFAESPSLLIQEKVQDLEDLLRRLLNNLLGDKYRREWYEQHIVIAHDLFPSDLLKLSSQNVAGIILVRGGVSSHVSILTRSLQIPLVIANVPELMYVAEKTMVILDAEVGNIYLNPSDEILKQFQRTMSSRKSLKEEAEILKKPTLTKDGTKLFIYSNINLLSDIKLAKDAYSEGIGLYRTEFPFLVRSNFPSEEEQFVIYQKLIAEMPGKPITFRTLDIGGDKVLSYFQDSREENPSMGMRSIRFSLQYPDVFSQQIRAILRAGVNADIRIMFPMISSLDELIRAKDIMQECKDSLAANGIPFHSSPKIGVMVEIPSLVSILEEVAAYVDFFSIGTNDLIQFLLAVDRTNEKLTEFYNPYHPAILRTLKKIMEIGIKQKKEVSICGDIAHDEHYLAFLIGVGFRQLSLDANYIPKVKKAIATIDLKQAVRFSAQLLSYSRIHDVEMALAKTKTD